jgi:hypothetical protein
MAGLGPDHPRLSCFTAFNITPKTGTREEIEEKRRFYTEAFNALTLKGLGVIREDAVIELQ